MKNTFAAHRHLPTDKVHILDLALFSKQTTQDGATSLVCEYINEDGEKVFAVIASGEQDEPSVTYVPVSEKENREIMAAYFAATLVIDWSNGKASPKFREYGFNIDSSNPDHIVATMEFIEPKGHKKDVWIKSEQLPPDAIGELGRIWGASIRVLCFSPEWGKRWGWHTRLAGKWSVDGVTSADGVNVTWWMDVSDPMEVIKPAKS